MLLSADALTCRRGQAVVLRDLSFTLGDGQTMAVTGPNGVGKSTLLRLIAGLNDVISGSLQSVTAHWIGPDLPLKPALSVKDNLKFWQAMQGGTTGPDTIIRALHRFEIAHLCDRRIDTLSSGQKRRVALARLFLTPQKLWLLDEPENNLDAEGREMMLAALSDHTGNNGGAIIATHQAELWNDAIQLDITVPSPQPENIRNDIDAPERSVPLVRAFLATLSRDLMLLQSNRVDALQPVLLFLLMTTLFPLALSPDATTLAPIAGGLVMMAVFFASLLPLENIFVDDAKDGTIETLMTTPAPLSVYAAARLAAHWLTNGLVVTLVAPVALMMLGAHNFMIVPVLTIVFTATLLFTLIGSGISALVLSTNKGGLLLALLAAPLYIPVLIFSSGGLNQIAAGHAASTPTLLLWAMTALFIPLAPLLTAGCLRLMRD